ncbi:hypothetical protein A4X13_0g7581 [Tilletia indica]|uniref:Protein kinase domain-containing protein n=1 Tax=Tilletia indica TaxID=43049 RepID=A0A8T8SJ25_9BASI|nr:hypothetical protein A4X13_0g7581 [Tilletia indica]
MVMLDTSLLDDIDADSAGKDIFTPTTTTTIRRSGSSMITGAKAAPTTSHAAAATTSAAGMSSSSSSSDTSSGSSSRRRSGSGSSSSHSRRNSITGRHSLHMHQHSGPIDLISASSTSSAIGLLSSNASVESHPATAFSTTPSALFSASSSLSSMSTPQHYKNVKPLQDAFSSTGLASKKLRAVGKRPRASAPGSLPLSSFTPHKPMPDTPVKSKASRSQSFISLRQPPLNGFHQGFSNIGIANDASGSASVFSRRHARISTESSSHMRRAVSAGVVSTPPRAYEAMFNENSESDDDVGRFARRFTVISVLGSGEFSEAVEVEERGTKARYAIKRTKRPATGSKARLRRLEEVDILRELSRSRQSSSNAPQPHPNIVTLIDAWEEEGHLFMQLELCPLGNLADFFEEHGATSGPLDEPRLWKVLTELAHGLSYIHSNGILHLDLKPANVFITAFGSLKIGDFGLASRWPRSGAAEIVDGAGLVLGPDDDLDRVALELAEEVGSPNLDDLDLPRFGPAGEERDKRHAAARSPNKIPRAFRRLMLEREGDREYLAPEIMSRGQYGRPADMYSLGILMLEAAANVVMPDNGEAYQKLRNDDFSDVDISHLSDQLVEILTGSRGLLRSNPMLRPSAEVLESNQTIARVRQWMSRGLTSEEERRFVLAVASRNEPIPQSLPALKDFNRILPRSTDSDDPFLGPRRDDVFTTNADADEPPRTATRAFFADPTALTTPVNGYKVLFPPPPTPFPSSDLSPIADIPSSQGSESATPERLPASVAGLSDTVPQWRGAIVEEDNDAMMGEILGIHDRGSTSIDDIEMSF